MIQGRRVALRPVAHASGSSDPFAATANRELCQVLDEELDRALDLGAQGGVRIKFLRTEDLAENRAQLKIVVAKARGDHVDDCGRRVVFGEEAPEFPGEELRACGLFDQNVNDVVAAPVPGFSHERFGAGIGLAGGESEFGIFGFRELLRRRALDIVQPDIARVGGFTAAMRLGALVHAHNVRYAPHSAQTTEISNKRPSAAFDCGDATLI